MTIDLRLYVLLDPTVAGERPLPELARLVVGRATLVQLRDKHGSTRAMVEQARRLRAILEPVGVPLLINDRVDVALAAEADGVHLGQDDMAPADARLLLGRSAVIGLSIGTVAEAQAAPLELVDYLAVGNVFATTSKDAASPPVGLGGLRDIVHAARARAKNFPICAIAGITERNAANVVIAGADGVAVIAAIARAEDPAQAARDLRAVVEDALHRRSP